MKALFKLICLAVLVGGFQTAHAASYIFDLNCSGATNNACTVGSSYGSVTIADTATTGEVDITVALSDSGWTFKDLTLNFDPGSSITSLTDGTDTFAISQNSISLSPWNGFDTQTNDNNQSQPVTTTLSNVNGENLTADHFLFLNTIVNPNLYLALHIQNCGSDSTCANNGNSLKVGATGFEPGPGPGVVPVPAAVWLFGSGLLGLIGLRRRGGSLAA